MATKIVIGEKSSGKTKQFEIEDIQSILGKKIHDNISIDIPELAGYELTITGGSDSAGFPMRFDVDTERKKIFAVSGIGVHSKRKGCKTRKTVAGRMITEKTAQINCIVKKAGKVSIFKDPVPAEEEKKEGESKVAPEQASEDKTEEKK